VQGLAFRCQLPTSHFQFPVRSRQEVGSWDLEVGGLDYFPLATLRFPLHFSLGTQHFAPRA
jgi:hypothetical protein